MSGWSLNEIEDSRHKFRQFLRLILNLLSFGNNPSFFLHILISCVPCIGTAIKNWLKLAWRQWAAGIR